MQSELKGYFFGTTPETGPIVYEFSEEGKCVWHTLANVQTTDFYFDENDSKIAFCVPSLRQKVAPKASVTEVTETEVTETETTPEVAVPEEGAPAVSATTENEPKVEDVVEEKVVSEEPTTTSSTAETETTTSKTVLVKDSMDAYDYKLKLHGFIDIINDNEIVLYQSKVANIPSDMDKCDVVRCTRVDTPNVIFKCDGKVFDEDEHVRKLKCLAECREKVCNYIREMELPSTNVNINTIMRHPEVHKMLTITIPSAYGIRFNAFMKDKNPEVQKLFGDTIMKIEAATKDRLLPIIMHAQQKKKAAREEVIKKREEVIKRRVMVKKQKDEQRIYAAAGVGILSSLLTIASFVMWQKIKKNE